MQRRQFIFQAGAVAGVLMAAGPSVLAHPVNNKLSLKPLDKEHEEWRSLVSKREYDVLFEEDTEPSGSSPLNHVEDDGTFICSACYLPLFEFDKKYESGTGWPSFYNVIVGRVATKLDLKLIWPRTEYHCIRCGGHQGHLFKDGPQPTGLRYCNNGLALKFVPADKPLPKLRG